MNALLNYTTRALSNEEREKIEREVASLLSTIQSKEERIATLSKDDISLQSARKNLQEKVQKDKERLAQLQSQL